MPKLLCRVDRDDDDDADADADADCSNLTSVSRAWYRPGLTRKIAPNLC